MSIADTGRFWEILVIPVLQILEDSEKYWLYQYCRYWKILKNTGYTSIADTWRCWKILVIPVLQILEDSRKYWLYQYCRYWKIRYEVAVCTCILFFFVLSVRLLWEDGQCIGRPGERRLGAGEGGERKEGREKGIFRNLLVMGFVYRKSHFYMFD